MRQQKGLVNNQTYELEKICKGDRNSGVIFMWVVIEAMKGNGITEGDNRRQPQTNQQTKT